MRLLTVLLVLVCAQLCFGVDFDYHQIDTGVGFVRVVQDINGDGLPDIFAYSDGGFAWYEYPTWTKHTVVGSEFNHAGDDLEAADIDGDGDIDIISSRMDNGDGRVMLLENPLPDGDPTSLWNYYQIGDAGQVSNDNHIKDLGVADFNGDGYLDVCARVHTFTYIFLQQDDGSWTQVKRIDGHPPLEGLYIADLDRDGDPDLVLNGFWLRNPHPAPLTETWSYFEIDPAYHDEGGTWPHSAAKVAVVDINGDGQLNVIFSDSEQDPVEYPDQADPIAWYSAADPTGPWVQHVIDSQLGEAHTLQPTDLDLDGDLDIVTGQMSDQGLAPVRIYYNQGAANSWLPEDISNNGIYGGVIGDIGSDGDLDLVGIQDWSDPVMELFENTLHGDFSLDQWQYLLVDDSREEFSSNAFLGLDIGDLTHDGLPDIVSGKYFYGNLGGDLAQWNRVTFPVNVDASLIVDVDGDQFGDAVGMARDKFYWIEASDPQGTSWTSRQVQTVDPTGHDNSQGYTLAQIVPGGRPEIVMAFGDGMWYLTIPSDPENEIWPKVQIQSDNQGGGLATGYIDGDPYIDVVAPSSAQEVAWYRNPGDGSGNWTRFDLGVVGPDRADRFAVADINLDGRRDVVVSTEEYPHSGEAYLYWFEAPEYPATESWTRHQIPPGMQHDSLNSLDVADMDSDGDIDLVTGEVFGDLQVKIWENDGTGVFTEHLVDSGHESHLGTRVSDLDNDGDLDIVSIAWHQPQDLHLWRNLTFDGGEISSVFPEDGLPVEGAPGAPLLDQNIPNPFNPWTSIRFELSQSDTVWMTVYDVSGRAVRRLLAGTLIPQGDQVVYWDGKDDEARSLPSGIYFYQLRAGDWSQTKRMMLMK